MRIWEMKAWFAYHINIKVYDEVPGGLDLRTYLELDKMLWSLDNEHTGG